VPDVHRHYVGLFVAAGWRKVEDGSGTAMGMTTFEITDKNGQRWHVALATSAPPGTEEVDLHLTVRKP
jgi:hypothetical protein